MASYLKHLLSFTAPVATSEKNLYSEVVGVLGKPPQGEGLQVSFKYNGFNKQWLIDEIKDPKNFPNAEISPDTNQGKNVFVIFRGEEARKFRENYAEFKKHNKANER